jgi:heme exporter protein A
VLDFDRIEARGLVKLFGATPALAGVDLNLQAGSVTSVEGPNGAGKTTLLSILALLARPTSGQLHFGKYDVRRRPALRGSIGLLGHTAMVYPELSGSENLALFAGLYGRSWGEGELAAARERFALGDWVDRPVATYSRGQLQRLALARALGHEPRLLLLDEPSTGLDARATERLRDTIRSERERGAIVLLVTHDAALAEAVADHRLHLKGGRLAEGVA